MSETVGEVVIQGTESESCMALKNSKGFGFLSL